MKYINHDHDDSSSVMTQESDDTFAQKREIKIYFISKFSVYSLYTRLRNNAPPNPPKSGGLWTSWSSLLSPV